MAGHRRNYQYKIKKSTVPYCIIKNRETCTEPYQSVDKFNNYLSIIADSIFKERKYKGNKTFRDFIKNPLSNSFAFTPWGASISIIRTFDKIVTNVVEQVLIFWLLPKHEKQDHHFHMYNDLYQLKKGLLYSCACRFSSSET